MTFPPTRPFSIIPPPPQDPNREPVSFEWGPTSDDVLSSEQLAKSARKEREADHVFTDEAVPAGFEVIPAEGTILPIEHPAYSAFPDGVIPDIRGRIVDVSGADEPASMPPSARERFEQRQAEREDRRNTQGFDWGFDEDAPRGPRQWRALDLSIMFIIMVLIIIDIIGILIGPFDLWSVGIAFGAVCGLIVATGTWDRYDIGTQLRALLVDVRLIKDEG